MCSHGSREVGEGGWGLPKDCKIILGEVFLPLVTPIVIKDVTPNNLAIFVGV